MSITNYFGKPRAKYVAYKSPYTFDNLPLRKYRHIHYMDLPITHGIPRQISYLSPINSSDKDDKFLIQDDTLASEIKSEIYKINSLPPYFPAMSTLDTSKQQVYSFLYERHAQVDSPEGIKCVSYNYELKNIHTTFNKFLQETIEWIERPIWKLLNIPPIVSIYQIFILKHSDTDKRIEHLEKMVASLCEDNTLLNNRIKELEQQLSRQAEIPVAEPVKEHITIAEAVLAHSLPK